MPAGPYFAFHGMPQRGDIARSAPVPWPYGPDAHAAPWKRDRINRIKAEMDREVVLYRLRELREAADFTQSALAKAIGVGQNRVSQMEHGLWAPAVSTLCVSTSSQRTVSWNCPSSVPTARAFCCPYSRGVWRAHRARDHFHRRAHRHNNSDYGKAEHRRGARIARPARPEPQPREPG